MAGNALGADPFLFDGLVETVHDALVVVLLGPAVLGHQVDEEAVNIIGVVGLAMFVNGGEHVGGGAHDL